MPEKKHLNNNLIIMLLTVLLIVCALISLTLGRYDVTISDILKAIGSKLFKINTNYPEVVDTVIYNIRMPRIIIAALVGCCLSAAGAAYQGVFQNPMSSPDILGASNGAAFGAALAILMGASHKWITLSAFTFSIIAVALVFFIGERAKGKKILTLILAGIMIGSLFSAGTSFIKLVADPNSQLPEITYWLMGSLSGAKKSEVLFAFVPMAIGLIPMLLLRWRINILTLGDDEARALGVNTHLLRAIIIICSTLITAASVSVSGMIGWVGLVIPHLARKLVGNNYKYLLPASMIIGATFLLIVDDISRNLFAVEIPIGILTALIGAPFFIWLIVRKEETY